jgi:beta-glucosidase
VQFPSQFLWGSATASHQVEGDNRRNDWWEYEQEGRVPYRSGVACDHFNRFAADFSLAQSLGQNAHRLSLEWSRIEPEAGQWNESAIEHYAGVLDALRARGIEPLVTLHHFTNPAWFLRQGGWLQPDSVEKFARYVEYVATRLGDKVRYWLTINEPTVYIKQAYVTGRWPPCRRGSWSAAYKALRSLCRAHTAAYDVLHRQRADVQVGFAHSAPYIAALDPANPFDRFVVAVRDQILNRHCFRLLGRPPGQVLDFIGVNYYTRQLVHHSWLGTALLVGKECPAAGPGPQRTFNSLGWEIYPAGLTAILEQFSAYGLPLIVTENGIATDDEAERNAFVRQHLEALARAVRLGIDVRGYFYWSLFDNFEWAEGFAPHFGLAAIEHPSLNRQLRPAAQYYADVCRGRIVQLPD